MTRLQRQVMRLRLYGLLMWVCHPISVLLNVGAFLSVFTFLSLGTALVEKPDLYVGLRLMLLSPFGILVFWWRLAQLHFLLTAPPRIVPYFRGRPGLRTSTFSHGFALATQMELLDNLADQNGVRHLSAFGFSDDALFQRVIWHSPTDGAATVGALQAQTTGPLQNELNALRAALDVAVSRDRLFSLIVRLGSDEAVSPVEMDARQGSF